MTNTVISTHDIRTNYMFDMTFEDTFILTEGASLNWFGTSGFDSDFSPISGLRGANDIAIYGNAYLGSIFTTNQSTLLVGAEGSIAVSTDITISFASTMTNYGEITSSTRSTTAVIVLQYSSHLYNHGDITAINAVLMNNVNPWGTDSKAINSGTIQAQLNGVIMAASLSDLFNSGSILSHETGVQLQGEGPAQDGDAVMDIMNAGHIQGGTTAILNLAVRGTSVLNLDNTGTIFGGDTAFQGGAGIDNITNSGKITGNVILGNGNNTYDGRSGQVIGTVVGGNDNDFYWIDDPNIRISDKSGGFDMVGAACSYRLESGLEVLTLTGNGDFRGWGNEVGNTLDGNTGDNRLGGLQGNDSMTGGLGNDTMMGGANNDTMLGGDGDDLLQGNVGNDTARGEDGDDVVNGGAGSDLIAGGAGLDTFVFSALAHTTNVLGTADIVSDFVKGEDKVDLSAIDAITTNATPDNAFTFIGTGAFTNVAGQLRYSQAAGYTNVEMDVDGNGTIDGIVRLFGTITLNANDFVL